MDDPVRGADEQPTRLVVLFLAGLPSGSEDNLSRASILPWQPVFVVQDTLLHLLLRVDPWLALRHARALG